MILENKHIWCVIPVYNNCKTIKKVVVECKKYLDNILVIDDGSKDTNLSQLLKDEDIKIIRHEKNLGKGQALKTALNFLAGQKAVYMITIDSDGQHYPSDIPKLISAVNKNDYTLAIGCRDFNTENVPESSRFGRKFSNMWIRLETGLNLKDTQSGFRAYPVRYISKLKLLSSSYDFEIEILTKAVWSGVEVKEVPIRVHYPPAGERISHFKPFCDNLRISLIHSLLILLRILPIPYKKLRKNPEDKIDYRILFHPIKLFKSLLKEYSSPGEIALSAGIGTLMAVLPLIGFHSVAILYAAIKLRLNKVVAFNIQHLFMPPLTPVLCVEFGHLILHGKLFTDISFQTLCIQFPERILEWLIGALILAPVFAVIMGLTVYIICLIINNYKKQKQHE